MEEGTTTEPEADASPEDPTDAPNGRISRRTMLGSLGLVAGGVAGYATGVLRSDSAARERPEGVDPAGDIVPFFGEHQAGITTQQQPYVAFAAFDLVRKDVERVRELLIAWTEAGFRLSRGQLLGNGDQVPLEPPDDTGEAMDLGPANLTLTFGFGPSFFDAFGKRSGIRGRRPEALVDIPAFPMDLLREELSGGDLCVQACADDPQVAFHAVRNLIRIGRGTVVVRWLQEGFLKHPPEGGTPRNLMGFKDGTANPHPADPIKMNEFVWVPPGEGEPWMAGGSYLVARRIRMTIELWDRTHLKEQERTIGRHKVSGAPLGGTDEHEELPLDARTPQGTPALPMRSHVRLAHHAAPAEQFLRRGYSFSDGLDEVTGDLDAGLFFLAWQRDPRAQFIPVQQRLATDDRLNEYIKHLGSAIFAVPPGATPGGFIGQELFEGR
jgi:deferrochelatase/peroxidase EfeB